MATSLPSYSNVFVPGFDRSTTGRLIVDYSRNWKDNVTNMLYTVSPQDYPKGFYARIKPEAQGRIVNSPQSYVWADGAPRPIQVENDADFDFTSFDIKRYVRTSSKGYMTINNASWDLEANVENTLANQSMTARFVGFYDVLQTSGNYISGHTDTMANWGGTWSTSTTTQRYIQKSLMAMARKINLATMGKVKLSDLFLVVSPVVADLMARSPEISDYLSGSPYAGPYLEFKAWADQNALYGLPPVLYGVKIVVDEWVKDATKLGATSSKAYLPGDTSAFMITKANALSSTAGKGSFSSIHAFVLKDYEMRVEQHDEPLNHRKVLSVIDSWDFKAVAQETMAACTSIS